MSIPTANHPQRPILLIGGTGQVGLELCRSLSGFGPLVVTARHPPTGSSVLSLDLADLDQLRSLVRELRPGLIVNAAAYTAVDQAESDVANAMLINGTAPGVLAEEAARVGAALIHYSTDYVFSGSGEAPWQEGNVTGPLNVYGRSKLAGEQAIQQVGVPHLILRTSWIYGPHGHNFVRSILRRMLRADPMQVVSDQIGAPTPARLVAEATARVIALAGSDIAGFLRQNGGIVHAACAGETTWHGFAQELLRLARAAGWPVAVERMDAVTTEQYPSAARRPLNSRLDSRLLDQRFGIRLPDWRSALQDEFPAIMRELLQELSQSTPRLVPEEPLPPYSYVPGHSFPHPIRDPAGHSFGYQPPHPAKPDPARWEECRPYLVGLDLFNQGFYWEAHEVWESLWHACGRAGPMADFFKGLIKLAAAGVKAREGRPAGVVAHASRAGELFRAVSDTGNVAAGRYFGLSLNELLAVAEAAESCSVPDEDFNQGTKIVFPFVLWPANDARLRPSSS